MPLLCEKSAGAPFVSRALAIGMLVGLFSPSGGLAQSRPQAKRPITVADIVELTAIGSQPWGLSLDKRQEDIDIRSVDGRLSATVIRKPNIARNAIDYALLVFRVRDLLDRPRPDTALHWSSTSNRAAIHKLKWLDDSRTIAFLGEQPGEQPQVYTIDTETREVTRRSVSRTIVTDYAVNGTYLFIEAEEPRDTTGFAAMRRDGFAVSPLQFVGDLAGGDWAGVPPAWSERARRIYAANRLGEPERWLTIPGFANRLRRFPLISPDGRYALFLRADVPEVGFAPIAGPMALADTLYWLHVVDVQEGTERRLGRALVRDVRHAHAAWLPDGSSVVVSSVLVGDSAAGRTLEGRSTTQALVEIGLSDGRVIEITRDSVVAVAWSIHRDQLEVQLGGRKGAARNVTFARSGAGWKAGPPAEPIKLRSPNVRAEYSLNRPTRLIAEDSTSGRRSVILDPTAGELVGKQLVDVQIIRGRVPNGRNWVAGLYLPPNRQSGERYPLVIQTHGFEPDVFAPQGYGTNGYAAQPLAMHGIAVVQFDEPDVLQAFGDTLELPSAAAGYEAVVQELDSLGLVDRTRVGLQGWSRTGQWIYYALQHSGVPFAAAFVSDAQTGGYYEKISIQNVHPGYTTEGEELFGAPPQEAGLAKWASRAPGFNMHRVRAPIRIEFNDPAQFLFVWEPYARLLEFGKPVELFLYPDGAHQLVKPAHRLSSAEGALDWFRFWLKGEEDPADHKRARYECWRRLRGLSETNRRLETQ